jgi:hypothetical protein
MARKATSRSPRRKSISHPQATRWVAAAALDVAPTAFSLSNAEVERALRTGERAGLLEDLFGAPAYAELRALARDAEAAKQPAAPSLIRAAQNARLISAP